MPSVVILRRIIPHRLAACAGGSRASLFEVVGVQYLVHIVDVPDAPPAR